MTGIMLALALSLVVLAALWKFGRLSGRWPEAVTLILGLGLAGYVATGSPNLTGQPHPPRSNALRDDTLFAVERRKLLGQLGDVGAWLNYADALERAGATRYAVTAMQEAVRRNPRSADLWLGLGNALAVHAGGMVTPAARMAFDHAAELAPEHPGPAYYLGLALLQGGRVDEALAEWQSLVDRSPRDARWLPLIRQRIEQVKAVMNMPQGAR